MSNLIISNKYLKKSFLFFFITVLLLTKFLAQEAYAETNFVKYKNILIPFTNKADLVINTESPSSITSSSADLNLTLVSGEPNIQVWFEFSLSSQISCPISAPSTSQALSVEESLSLTKTGLTPATVYYFIACAVNDSGESTSGATLSFETSREPTAVSLSEATEITVNSAVLNGVIDSGTDIDTWFVYSLSNNIQCGVAPSSSFKGGNTGETKSLQLTSLQAQSTYYYLYCASGHDGIKSSIPNTFTTLLPTSFGIPTITSLTPTSVILNVNFITGENITSWFETSINSSDSLACRTPAPSTAVIGSNGGDTNSTLITSLIPNTQYSYRFCTLAHDGLKSSIKKAFLTPQTIIQTENIDVNSVSQTNADLTGSIISGAGITTWFITSLDNNLNCLNPVEPSSAGGNDGDVITKNIESLLPNTDYYYRFCGLGNDGIKSGTIKTFKTLADPTSIGSTVFSNKTDDSISLTNTVLSGQSVETWYVLREKYRASCETSTKRHQITLNANEKNIYTADGLNDYTLYSVGFCALSQDGTLSEKYQAFTTLRTLNKEYERQCSDIYEYNSSAGPLFVDVQLSLLPDIYDTAIIRIENTGNSDMSYQHGGNLGFSPNRVVKSGEVDTLQLVPRSSSYRIRIYDGNTSWTARLGCRSKNTLF